MTEKKETSQIACEMIQDLLSLYHDGVVHENTGRVVQTHLEQCEACKKEYAALCDELPLAEVRISTKERFLKMMHVQKRRRFSVTVLISLAAALLLLGSGFFCTLYGFPLSSQEVQMEAGLHYSEEAYLNQAFEVHLLRTNGKPLWISAKRVFDEDGNLIGTEITPQKHLINIAPPTDGYMTGYSRADDGTVPEENFDYTITVKFSDKTVTYSMNEEGLFLPRKDAGQ